MLLSRILRIGKMPDLIASRRTQTQFFLEKPRENNNVNYLLEAAPELREVKLVDAHGALECRAGTGRGCHGGHRRRRLVAHLHSGRR
jgi:hypothetical protein